MLTGVFTVRIAAVLFAVPTKFTAVSRNSFPDIACVMFVTVSDGVVLPLNTAPSVVLLNVTPSVEICHCKVGIGLPLAAPLKVVDCPTTRVRLVGCNVIAGPAFTVSDPAELATVEAAFVASNWNKLPLCAAVTPITVSVVVLLPEKPAPLVILLQVLPPSSDTCHCSVGAGVPPATAVNVAFPPAPSVTFPGCVENDGVTFTVKVAFVLGVTPPVSVPTARNRFPFCPTTGAITVKVALVLPEKPAPFVMFVNVPFVDTCHCSVGDGFPLTTTVNVAFPAPCVTVALDGCVVNVGGTSSVAFVLFTPAGDTEFVATARNTFVLCVEFTASTVKVVPVFPEKFAPFVMLVNVPFVDTCHCKVGAGFPVVATVNVAFAPTATVEFVGCVLKAGAKFTVSVAFVLGCVPVVALIASTCTIHPFSVEFVASAVSVAVLFPENAALFVMLANGPPFVDSFQTKDVAPVAATGPNVAFPPAVTVAFAGCVVNTGCACAFPHPARASRPSARVRRQLRPRVLTIPLHKDVFRFIMG
jgi:hypothetical protein